MDWHILYATATKFVCHVSQPSIFVIDRLDSTYQRKSTTNYIGPDLFIFELEFAVDSNIKSALETIIVIYQNQSVDLRILTLTQARPWYPPIPYLSSILYKSWRKIWLSIFHPNIYGALLKTPKAEKRQVQ